MSQNHRTRVQEETTACRRQLREIYMRRPFAPDGRHLVKTGDTPQLTLEDIAVHLKTSLKWLKNHQQPNAPKACKGGCGTIDVCPLIPDCRSMNPKLRRAILQFFLEWNAGLIRKAYVHGHWQLIPNANRKKAAQMGAPARTASNGHTLHLVIDRETLGLKVK